jgi:hypothetical protein
MQFPAYTVDDGHRTVQHVFNNFKHLRFIKFINGARMK